MVYQCESEIEAIVNGFESCETAADAFTHAEHLVVAAYYLRGNSEEAALEKMRRGLLRFLHHYEADSQKYNETITLFWLRQVSACIEVCGEEFSWTDKVNRAVALLGDSRLISMFYSSELLKSERAKTSWVDPDLKNLSNR